MDIWGESSELRFREDIGFWNNFAGRSRRDLHFWRYRYFISRSIAVREVQRRPCIDASVIAVKGLLSAHLQ